MAVITNTLPEQGQGQGQATILCRPMRRHCGQLVHLPGLACRNYPNALRPIVEKLPTFLQSKWEKKVIKYADDHQNAYPGFHDFASMVIAVARMKNHPNVLASGVLKDDEQKRERTPRKKPPAALVDNVDRKVLKGNLEDDAGDGEVAPTKKKYCPFTIIQVMILPSVRHLQRKPSRRKLRGYQRLG